MKSQNISNILQTSAMPKLNIKSGDFIKINVVKRLIKNKWAVSVKGKVFSALSDIDLIPGQKLKALVNQSGNKLYFQIQDSKSELLHNIMNQFGASDNLSKLILTSLIRSRMPITSGILHKIRNYLLRNKKNNKRTARSLSILLKKNIDISSEGIDSVLKILDFDDGNQKDKNKQKYKDEPEHKEKIKTALKKQIEKTSRTGDHPLQLFNHLNGKEENWIIIPYNFNIDGIQYKGKIKMLYDYYNNKIVKFVFSVKSIYNSEWDIYCKENNNNTKLIVFCNNLKFKKIFEKQIELLKIAFNKQNIEIDTKLHSAIEFDGFSSDWDDISLKKIDTFT